MSLTPEQFAKLVTKEDLDARLENIATKDDVHEILAAVDGIAKKHEDFKTEMASNQGAHDRMSETIADHGVRIKKLELENV